MAYSDQIRPKSGSNSWQNPNSAECVRIASNAAAPDVHENIGSPPLSDGWCNADYRCGSDHLSYGFWLARWWWIAFLPQQFRRSIVENLFRSAMSFANNQRTRLAWVHKRTANRGGHSERFSSCGQIWIENRRSPAPDRRKTQGNLLTECTDDALRSLTELLKIDCEG